MADLKDGSLANNRLIIDMSLGSVYLDAVEKAAIDYAISKGVIIVASAGNNSKYGMGYPGAYAPVISVAASGWAGEWMNNYWLNSMFDPYPNIPSLYYITDFSSQALPEQDLDVTAPGSWIVGPYQVNMGQLSYYFLSGTSMASPHVAGTVALMAQKNPALTAAQAETILEESAFNFGWPAYLMGSGLLEATAAIAVTPLP